MYSNIEIKYNEILTKKEKLTKNLIDKDDFVEQLKSDNEKRVSIIHLNKDNLNEELKKQIIEKDKIIEQIRTEKNQLSLLNSSSLIENNELKNKILEVETKLN